MPTKPAYGQREKPLTDPETEFNRGVRLEEVGDAAAAEVAYRTADSLGHAAAACNLGVLLERGRQLAAAEAAYRRADARGYAGGAYNLGALLEETGALAAAEPAYRRADARGDGAAASNLGILLEQRGDLVGAEAAFRRAEERGDANGRFNLAAFLREHRGAADHPTLIPEGPEITRESGNGGADRVAGASPGLRGAKRAGRKRLLLAIGAALVAVAVAVTVIATRPPATAWLGASPAQQSDPQFVPAPPGAARGSSSRPQVVKPLLPAAKGKVTPSRRVAPGPEVQGGSRAGPRSVAR